MKYRIAAALGVLLALLLYAGMSYAQTTIQLPCVTCFIGSPAKATIQWRPPTQYESSAPLDDIGGYKIHIRQQGSSAIVVYDVPRPGARSHTVVLTIGTVYFIRISVYTTSGIESVLSAEVQHVAQPAIDFMRPQ